MHSVSDYIRSQILVASFLKFRLRWCLEYSHWNALHNEVLSSQELAITALQQIPRSLDLARSSAAPLVMGRRWRLACTRLLITSELLVGVMHGLRPLVLRWTFDKTYYNCIFYQINYKSSDSCIWPYFNAMFVTSISLFDYALSNVNRSWFMRWLALHQHVS